jgi:tripartite-type tricarboxylate transporter receptor subunit TctC
LRQDVVEIVQSDDFKKRMQELGANAAPSTGSEFAGRVRREIDEFNKVINARGIERQ